MEECAPGGLNSDGQKNANSVRSSGAVDYGLEGKYKKRVKAERLKCLAPSWSLDSEVSEDNICPV